MRLAAVVWLALGAWVAGARAQFWYAGSESGRLRESDIRYLTRKAALSEDQAEAAMNLFSGYDAQMDDASTRMESFQRAFFETHGRRLKPKSPEWERALGVYKEYGAFQKRLRERLLEDLKTVLSPEQSAGWESFERHLRRQRTLEACVSPIGSVDLVSLATQASEDQPLGAELTGLLDQYEIDLDRALAELESVSARIEEQAASLYADIETLPEEEQTARWMAVMAPMLEASKKVRDVNLRYAERIAGAIPSERVGRFESWFYSQADISQGDWEDAHQAIGDARDAPGLTPEQTQAIDLVEQDIRRESRRMAQESIRAMVASEDAGRHPWMDHEDPALEERAAERHERQRALTESCLDRLRSILTAEQLEEMEPPLRRLVIEFPTFPE